MLSPPTRLTVISTVPEDPTSLDLTHLSDETLEEMLAVIHKAVAADATAAGVLGLKAEVLHAKT